MGDTNSKMRDDEIDAVDGGDSHDGGAKNEVKKTKDIKNNDQTKEENSKIVTKVKQNVTNISKTDENTNKDTTKDTNKDKIKKDPSALLFNEKKQIFEQKSKNKPEQPIIHNTNSKKFIRQTTETHTPSDAVNKTKKEATHPHKTTDANKSKKNIYKNDATKSHPTNTNDIYQTFFNKLQTPFDEHTKDEIRNILQKMGKTELEQIEKLFEKDGELSTLITNLQTVDQQLYNHLKKTHESQQLYNNLYKLQIEFILLKCKNMLKTQQLNSEHSDNINALLHLLHNKFKTLNQIYDAKNKEQSGGTKNNQYYKYKYIMYKILYKKYKEQKLAV